MGIVVLISVVYPDLPQEGIESILFFLIMIAVASAISYPIFSPLRKGIPLDGLVRRYTQNHIQSAEVLDKEIKRLTGV